MFFLRKKRHTVYAVCLLYTKKAHVRSFTRHAPSFVFLDGNRYFKQMEGIEPSRSDSFVF